MNNTTATFDTNPKPLAYYQQDGLVDLFIGWVAFLGGLGFLTDLGYLGGIAPAIFLPVWQSLRQKITEPRLGKLETPRPILSLFTFTLLLGLVSLAAVFIFSQTMSIELANWLQEYSLILIGAIIAGLFALMGAALRYQRLIAYSGLLLVLFFAGNMLDLALGWILAAFGLVVVSSGSAILFRFIQKNPLRE